MTSRKGQPHPRVGVALLARQIADELFTFHALTGDEEADFLVQIAGNPEGDKWERRGYWTKQAVTRRIQMALMRGRYKR
ncbi:MAG TPA: hypothetical protein VJT67_07275 [Longimicrobiaceae bacterium]|nr:hypothetical protein [Longimicrobiaceae bacterium]